MYTITVDYTTGDSFSSERCTEEIGMCWESLELAREALKSIKQHYELYLERDGADCNTVKSKAGRFDWYKNDATKAKYDPWYFSLAVRCDDGEWRNIPCDMWTGYFERLHSARITSLFYEDSISLD